MGGAYLPVLMEAIPTKTPATPAQPLVLPAHTLRQTTRLDAVLVTQVFT
jgi:hypothetical protein